MIRYPDQTMQRAQRAIRCSPFEPQLFETMRCQSVSLLEIAGKVGLDQQYTQQPLPELKAENALLWLIQVGVLRREVDGQGLTDSFRLTPLGRQLIEQGQGQSSSWQSGSWIDHLQNTLNRWSRFSF